MLTIETIIAAQDNDLAAVAAIAEETASTVDRLSLNAAMRAAGTSRSRIAELREEYAQIARIEVWESTGDFGEETVGQFFAYMVKRIETRLNDEMRASRGGNCGYGKTAMKTFMAQLDAADGDAYEAARRAQTVPPKGQRLSAEMADTVRTAYLPPVALDAPPAGDGPSWSDLLATTLGVPEDLLTPRDLTEAQRKAKAVDVRNVMYSALGANQRMVLEATFGIGGATHYGYDDDAALGAALGLTALAVQQARSRGLKAFGAAWIQHVAADAGEAAVLTAAMDARLTRGA
ncbi:hypothetical protein AB0F32_24550 [Streptomyces albidoflavus]|uniref:hypothetical protein n=1 Tax=Streptomyces albidoflavus TaxID=1886 RepID=UPI0033EE5D67